MNEMKTVININGGIGREIMFSGVIDEYHKLHPEEEITIIAGMTDIFQNKNYINRVYPMHTPYLYEDVISKADKYIESEPYNDLDYFKNMRHFIEVANKQINGEFKFVKPNVELNEQEINLAKNFIEDWKKNNQNKKICMFQAYGQGGSYKMIDPTNRSLTDYEAETIVKLLKDNGYHVFMIGSDETKAIPGTQLFKGLPLRTIIAISQHVDLIVTIDSFMNHVAGMFEKPAIVLWKSTFVENLGYGCCVNIKPIGKPKRIPNRLPHNTPNAEQVNANIKADLKEFEKVLKTWQY